MAALNAAFHNVKWEEEIEKRVNERWNYFKSKIEEELKKRAFQRKEKNKS